MIYKKDQETAYAEIMHMFRYYYQTEWAPESMFKGKSRLWVQALNHLVTQGYVERKKTSHGYQYRWKAARPMHF